MKRNGLTSIVFSETPPNTNYTAGRWSWVSDDTAQEYIEDGYGKEWKPGEPETTEVETVKPKTKKFETTTMDSGGEKEFIEFEYPIHRGGGWYELSDGEKVKGKEEAQNKQDELNGE